MAYIGDTKISLLPPYGGPVTAVGDIPISINGVTYRISPNKLAAGNIGRPVSALYIDITGDGTSVVISGLVGKSIIMVLRGGIGTGKVITDGSPTGTQVLFDTTTGTLSVTADNKFVAEEQLTILFI